MENYQKGKNVEETLEKEKLPIPNLPSEFIWMQVSAGSKMRNLLGYAINAFQDQNAIVWSGSGPALSKTISCAEIMKRRFKHVHQINKICFRRIEEHWEPLLEELDPLVVVRDVPTIHILLSKETVDTEEPGYQEPLSQSTLRSKAPLKKFQRKETNQLSRKPRTTCVLGEFAPKVRSSHHKSGNDGESSNLCENGKKYEHEN